MKPFIPLILLSITLFLSCGTHPDALPDYPWLNWDMTVEEGKVALESQGYEVLIDEFQDLTSIAAFPEGKGYSLHFKKGNFYKFHHYISLDGMDKWEVKDAWGEKCMLFVLQLRGDTTGMNNELSQIGEEDDGWEWNFSKGRHMLEVRATYITPKFDIYIEDLEDYDG